MRLFRLIPIDHDPPSWQASDYRGEILVCAQSESAARELATVATAIYVRNNIIAESICPPWKQPSVVNVEDLGESNEKEEKILSPDDLE